MSSEPNPVNLGHGATCRWNPTLQVVSPGPPTDPENPPNLSLNIHERFYTYSMVLLNPWLQKKARGSLQCKPGRENLPLGSNKMNFKLDRLKHQLLPPPSPFSDFIPPWFGSISSYPSTLAIGSKDRPDFSRLQVFCCLAHAWLIWRKKNIKILETQARVAHTKFNQSAETENVQSSKRTRNIKFKASDPNKKKTCLNAHK